MCSGKNTWFRTPLRKIVSRKKRRGVYILFFNTLAIQIFRTEVKDGLYEPEGLQILSLRSRNSLHRSENIIFGNSIEDKKYVEKPMF
jgi:hypothetical protein